MNNYSFLEALFENLPSQTETTFKCQQCGICCRDRGDLLLTPMDVLVICKYLKISLQEFLNKYAYIKEFNNGFKNLYIKDNGNTQKTCIFFDETTKKCTINDVKPYPCFTFPFIEKDDKFIVQPAPCIHNGQKRKIRDIIIENSSRYLDEAIIFQRYINIFEKLLIKFQKPENKYFTDIIFSILFLELDVTREDYKEEIEEIFDKVEYILIFM